MPLLIVTALFFIISSYVCVEYVPNITKDGTQITYDFGKCPVWKEGGRYVYNSWLGTCNGQYTFRPKIEVYQYLIDYVERVNPMHVVTEFDLEKHVLVLEPRGLKTVTHIFHKVDSKVYGPHSKCQVKSVQKVQGSVCSQVGKHHECNAGFLYYEQC